MNNIVESNFEKDLSPRAQDFFAWSDNHTQEYIEPTQKPTVKHEESSRIISKDDAIELFEFDINAANRSAFGVGECSSM